MAFKDILNDNIVNEAVKGRKMRFILFSKF